MTKNFDIKDQKELSPILKRNVIDTMLYMILSFPFCSISNQHCILILNSLKEAFDLDDLTTLKNFVRKELDEQAIFRFDSSNKTSGMNMGQIIQIALELRNITQQALDEESSADEGSDNEQTRQKQEEISQWFKFCKNKVAKIERVWNRKLEEPFDEDNDSNVPENQDDDLERLDEDHESMLNNMLSQVASKTADNKAKGMSKSFSVKSDKDHDISETVE